MSTLDRIADKTLTLAPEQQERVLQFVESIESQGETGTRQPLTSLYGAWSGFDLSPEDIDAARREMWGDFPRRDL